MRRNELAPFGGSFFRDFDKGFDDFFNKPMINMGDLPKMDLMERDGVLVASFDVPGVKKENIHVEANNDMVSVWGERKDEFKGDLYSEKYYGSFRRSFKVPKDYNLDKLEANFEHGVLSLAIPHEEARESPTKKVEIQDGKKGMFQKLFGD